MSIRGTHRGIAYEIPANDDGAWRWVTYTQDSKGAIASLNVFPRPVFKTSGEAIEAAKTAIDKMLDNVSERAALNSKRKLVPARNRDYCREPD
jgi:hypothetical protein